MSKHAVATTDDLADGERIIVQIEGKEIAVFNVHGDYHAVLNWCPHQSGPLCEGPVDGTVSAEFDRETLEVEMNWVQDGEIVSCPWHGWEFDVLSGDCLSDAAIRVPTYPTTTENGSIIVEV